MIIRSIILLLLILATGNPCWTQTTSVAGPYDFLPRANVLFEDNFQSDTIGNFPAKWRIIKCIGSGKKDSAGIKFCQVGEDDAEHSLVFAPLKESHIEPNSNANHTVNDIFTLELDFNLGPLESNVTVDFQVAEKLGDCRSVFLSITQAGVVHYSTFSPRINILTSHIPGYFDKNVSHHLAVSYFKGSMNYYVDHYKLFSFPAVGYTPIKYGLSARGPAKIRNFRLATGVEVNEFFNLPKTKKMTSHDFLFYEGKSAMKSSSMRYVMELIQFLKAFPSSNLEIDVHSDDKGDATVISRVSVARAEEIKHQLVITGIDAKRITTKGLGDTVPLKPNDTPEGRAENRRVEFILQ